MRSTCSLYVDAGYLLASAATRVTGTSLRNGIHVAYGKLIEALVREAEEASGLPVLRVHWYDSAKDGVPDYRQQQIGELPKVKLRLGRFGVDGQQKGVDIRIGLDLVTHARNAAADIFFLVSGDDDLTEAVEQAQVHGVQVVVLAVPNADGRAHGVSRHLIRESDELATLKAATIDDAVTKIELPKPAPEPAEAPVATPRVPSPLDVAAMAGRPTPHAPTPSRPAEPSSALAYSGTTGGPSHVMQGYGADDEYDVQIDQVAARVVASISKSADATELAGLRLGRPSIPREIDKALLLDLSDALGEYDLSDPVRFRLRERFWAAYDESPLAR